MTASCASPGVQPAVQPTQTSTAATPSPSIPAATTVPTAAAPTIASPTLDATAAASPTQTPAASRTGLCSPLADISLAELAGPDLLKQPFQLPRPGMDDGHHGADFAYWSRGERKTMLDLPVYSVLDGAVAAVLDDRIPYGYTVIIETALEQLPPHWLGESVIPTPAPTVVPGRSLFCPTPTVADRPAGGPRSLYLLYAHLSQPPALRVGQAVACGENIGLVGTTGNSVNYHLHLETRVGPSGMVFEPMTHYDNRATESEMRSYCTWRVSGLFQMFDPMDLLALQP